MKRMFALTLVLVMALSMMALSASAVSFTCPNHPEVDAYCTEHWGPNISHCYIREITADGTVKYCLFLSENRGYLCDAEAPLTYWTDFKGFTPEVGMLIWDEDEEPGVGICKYPSAPAQPKTGVMDTLPIWFAVCAVSACAYILTSKKKVF